jgi:hypothetical protein
VDRGTRVVPGRLRAAIVLARVARVQVLQRSRGPSGRSSRLNALRLPLWGSYAAVSAVLGIVYFMVESGSRVQTGL